MRAIDKLERLTVIAGTLKQELLKRLYVVFGSECVNIHRLIPNPVPLDRTKFLYIDIGKSFLWIDQAQQNYFMT